MTAVPAEIPETTPLLMPTDTAVEPDVQVPPLPATLNVLVAPGHTTVVPVIPGASGLTVTSVDVLHPVPKVYVIVAVPVKLALIIPVAVPMLTLPGRLLLQTPPAGADDNELVAPKQTTVLPDIEEGRPLIVTTAVV